MIHVQLISRVGANIQKAIREAIESGSIRSFEITRIRGGMRIKHKKHPGEIRFEQTPGPTVATLVCRTGQEWQLLEAFVGRVAYHFSDEVAAINIQMPAE